MTNNPTIDGVSREDDRHAAVKALHDIMQSVPSASLYSLAEAVLDAGYAPAVERCTSCDDSGDLTDLTGEWRGYCTCPAGEALKNKPAATPEVAALQSTIAQLQAEKELMLRCAEVLRERIAELESGKGEPVAYADPQAFENFKNHAHKGGHWDHEWMWAKPEDSRMVALYTEPPALVAVDENAEFEKWAVVHYGIGDDEELNLSHRHVKENKAGWMARSCLDATAALNEGQK